jgi:hypothetical protein
MDWAWVAEWDEKVEIEQGERNGHEGYFDHEFPSNCPGP